MSAPGSVYDAKKPPSKDDYELDDLPEVTQGTVTPVGIPPRGDPEYEAKLAQLFAHLPGGVKRIWLNR